MSLKIAAGLFKGRSLKTPDSTTTRPTTGMLRQAVFNICQDWVPGARFLDLFAGSGAMGFEALSRGANYVTFIDSDLQAAACIQGNAQQLSVMGKVQILKMEAKQSLKTLSTPYDLIYIDPPYDQDVRELFELLIEHKLLAPDGLIFLEERFNSKKSFALPTLDLLSSRRYGGSHLHQFRLCSRSL